MRVYVGKLGLPLILSLIVLAGCGSGAGNRQASSTAINLTIEAQSIAFSTDRLEVKAGQPVKLSFVNNDVVLHDFSVHEIGVTDVHAEDAGHHDMGHEEHMPVLHVTADAGETGVLTFTPTEPGEYEFVCTVPGHSNMVGTLVVKP